MAVPPGTHDCLCAALSHHDGAAPLQGIFVGGEFGKRRHVPAPSMGALAPPGSAQLAIRPTGGIITALALDLRLTLTSYWTPPALISWGLADPRSSSGCVIRARRSLCPLESRAPGIHRSREPATTRSL